MRTPFGYFGNKRRIAPAIWERFGDPTYYFEPFAGSLGCLLARPAPGRNEAIGDIDCQITNLWRAAKWASPQDLAQWAEWPVNSLDLGARLRWLSQQKQRLERRLADDPFFFDLKCAAWYAWVNSVRQHNQGKCIQLMRPKGVRRTSQPLNIYFQELADRMKNVTVHFGDWTHLANAALTASKRSYCAILLDPPYAGVREQLYDHHDRTLSKKCSEFAVAAAHPRLKVALCGLEGQFSMPAAWEELAWNSQGGKGRERIWFSPHCNRGVSVERAG